MDIAEVRRLRLKHWFANRTLPEKEKSYLSQLIHGKASFGERAARRLEHDYGMGERFLDKLPNVEGQTDLEEAAPTSPRKQVLFDLFDSLPQSEQDELIRTLKAKKQHYDKLFEELLTARKKMA